MAYDGFLGYINETDPVSSDIKNCIDNFLQLPKKEQNIYFAMYDKGLDYSESTDEFNKVIPYKMLPWIKSAVEYISNADKNECTEYALRKSVDNINSFKISGKKVESIYVDNEFNRVLYSDGTIQDLETGNEINDDNFISLLNKLKDNLKSNPNASKKDDIKPVKNKQMEELIKSEKAMERTISESIDKINENKEAEDTVKNNSPLSWDEFFMNVAMLASARSKDPSTKVGAVIVKDNHIVSTGYNGMPYVVNENGINNDDIYPWDRSDVPELSKYSYVVHAELNAILTANVSLKGASLYTTLACCNECAKAIVQSGIAKVYYIKDRDESIFNIGKRILKNAGVEVIKM